MTTIKPFTRQDGYTIFDNTILDYIMPSVSGNAWKVLCLIIRKTRGWQKESDEISFSQIRDGSGIKTNHTVARAVDELEQAGYIIVTRGAGDWDTNTYALNLDYELDTSPPSAKNALDASAKNALDPVQKMHTQNKESKQRKERRRAPQSTPPPYVDTPTPRPQVNDAFRVYVEETGNGAHASKVAIKAMERITDLDLWRKVVKRWLLCDWRPGNIQGMLDYYDRGELPGEKPKEQPRPTPKPVILNRQILADGTEVVW